MESHTRFLTSLSVTQSSNPKYCTFDGSPEQLKNKSSSLEDEVFKSNIQAYLNEKALCFKQLEKAWREELYNSTGHDEASSSLGFSESQKSKWKEELDQELVILREFKPKYYEVDGSPEQLKTKNSSLEDEVFISDNEAYLNEKALEFKKVEKALREEVYNNTDHGEASSSLGFSESQRLKWKEELDQELMRMRVYKKLEKALREVYNSTGHEEASSRLGFSERQRLKWKEELDQELMRMREMRRQASVRKNTIRRNTSVKNQI